MRPSCAPRVLKIAKLLTSEPYQYTRLRLATDFKVSKRTINRDLTFLRDLAGRSSATGRGLRLHAIFRYDHCSYANYWAEREAPSHANEGTVPCA